MLERTKYFLEPIREHGFIPTIRKVVSDPQSLVRYASYDRSLAKYREEGPLTPTEVENFIHGVTGIPRRKALEAWIELHDDVEFRQSMEENLMGTHGGSDKLYHNWRELLYVLGRVTTPEVVVETGVANGLSSAYLLNALRKNSGGKLTSIDIGDTTVIPRDVPDRSVGWVVPSYLDDYWDLRIGDSSELLPQYMEEADVDLFFSDVPNDLLELELRIAGEHMGSGSVVFSSYPINSRAEEVWGSFADENLENTVTAPRAMYGDKASICCAGVIK